VIEGARKRGRNGPRDSAAILLAYRHGLRAAELCSLYKLANDGHELGASQFAINSAIHSPGSGSVCEVLAGLGRGPRFYVVMHSRYRSAPRVIAALAGFVHDGQSAADYEYNHDNNNERITAPTSEGVRGDGDPRSGPGSLGGGTGPPFSDLQR
jgi:hypothetical protein